MTNKYPRFENGKYDLDLLNTQMIHMYIKLIGCQTFPLQLSVYVKVFGSFILAPVLTA